MSAGRPEGTYTQALRVLFIRTALIVAWPKLVNAHALAAKFAVSSRTIRRDMAVLIASGDAIATGHSRWGWRLPAVSDRAAKTMATVPLGKRARAAMAAVIERQTPQSGAEE